MPALTVVFQAIYMNGLLNFYVYMCDLVIMINGFIYSTQDAFSKKKTSCEIVMKFELMLMYMQLLFRQTPKL